MAQLSAATATLLWAAVQAIVEEPRPAHAFGTCGNIMMMRTSFQYRTSLTILGFLRNSLAMIPSPYISAFEYPAITDAIFHTFIVVGAAEGGGRCRVFFFRYSDLFSHTSLLSFGFGCCLTFSQEHVVAVVEMEAAHVDKPEPALRLDSGSDCIQGNP